jgi:transketolase
VFATRRAYDFIHQVIAEEHLNVKICAALPGLTTGYGPSHQATEDLAIMRGVPGLTIVDPCDALDTDQAVRAIADHNGPVYMRLLRGKVPLVLDKYDYKFELGKAKLLEEGNDVLIISSGIMTMRALEAAEKLRHDNVSVAVLHVPTIKPLDEQTILAQAAKPGRLVVTAENHTCVGGLSEAVAALLLRKRVSCEFDVVSLPDEFLHAGALPTLHDRYGISTTAMVEKSNCVFNSHLAAVLLRRHGYPVKLPAGTAATRRLPPFQRAVDAAECRISSVISEGRPSRSGKPFHSPAPLLTYSVIGPTA